MKKLVLIFGVIFMLTSETKAECLHGGNNCLTWNPGVADNCGKGCTYTYNEETSTVYVTASGDDAYMGRGYGSAFSPYDYDGNHFPSGVYFNKVVINGPIAIGKNAFTGKSTSISGADGTLTLTNIEHHGFGDKATLEGDIIIPSDAKFDSLAFHGVQLADGAKIYCSVENCAQKMKEACAYYNNNTDGYKERCLNAVESIVSDSDKFAQAPQGCSAFNGNGCNSCNNGYSLFSNQCVCAQNHRVNGKNCNRLIYTIDEANQVAGKTNSFKIRYR